MTVLTGNRDYPMPDEGGSQDVWGSELNAASGVGVGAPTTPVDKDTSAVPVPVGDGNWDNDIQDALNRGQQGLINADVAQVRAGLTLLRDGTEAMTGRIQHDVGIGTLAILDTGLSGAINVDISSDVNLLQITGNVTITFINQPTLSAGSIQMILIEIASTGAFTVTWPGSILFDLGTPPVQTPSGLDTYVFYRVQGGVFIGRRAIEAAA